MCLPRGMPRLPSIDAVRAVDSPQTKAPAPWLMRMSKSKPESRMFAPEQAALARLLEGVTQPLDGERVLVAHVDVALPARCAPIAKAAMIMPSITECGLPSSTERSMKAPGSPSSPLQMM